MLSAAIRRNYPPDCCCQTSDSQTVQLYQGVSSNSENFSSDSQWHTWTLTHTHRCKNKEQLSNAELLIISVFILIQRFGIYSCSKLLLQSYQTPNPQCFSELLMRCNNTLEGMLLFSTAYACMLSYGTYSHLCIHTRTIIAHGLYWKHEHMTLTHMSLNKKKTKAVNKGV